MKKSTRINAIWTCHASCIFNLAPKKKKNWRLTHQTQHWYRLVPVQQCRGHRLPQTPGFDIWILSFAEFLCIITDLETNITDSRLTRPSSDKWISKFFCILCGSGKHQNLFMPSKQVENKSRKAWKNNDEGLPETTHLFTENMKYIWIQVKKRKQPIHSAIPLYSSK